MLKPHELSALREIWEIESYDDVCYLKGGRDGCFNLLNEDSILKPSDTPELHPLIETLITNVCGGNEVNIEYIHKAILYKYLNINDHTIPAIVFYGTGGSGKGTMMSLLWTIFGKENTQVNLGQNDISWNFDTYAGQKIIVEFAEVTTNNTHQDIRTLNKLKNYIWAKYIHINKKGVQVYWIENIAWFFISSNSLKPLQLDSKDKWNRRFTVIKSTKPLENWKEINDVIEDKAIVSNYLAWLMKTYSDVEKYTFLEALDNKDKRELEEFTQSEVNDFWDWVEENYPQFRGKKTVNEVKQLITMFCIENEIDEKEFMRYFKNHSRYQKKRFRRNGKLHYWYDIPSEIATPEKAAAIFGSTIED